MKEIEVWVAVKLDDEARNPSVLRVFEGQLAASEWMEALLTKDQSVQWWASKGEDGSDWYHLSDGSAFVTRSAMELSPLTAVVSDAKRLAGAIKHLMDADESGASAEGELHTFLVDVIRALRGEVRAATVVGR